MTPIDGLNAHTTEASDHHHQRHQQGPAAARLVRDRPADELAERHPDEERGQRELHLGCPGVAGRARRSGTPARTCRWPAARSSSAGPRSPAPTPPRRSARDVPRRPSVGAERPCWCVVRSCFMTPCEARVRDGERVPVGRCTGRASLTPQRAGTVEDVDNKMQRCERSSRSRRAKLTPADVGLPDVGQRRVPGLRRGEVATLAGVSIEYYSKLERGAIAGASAPRSSRRSPRHCGSTTPNAAHLFDLARAADGVPTSGRSAPPRRAKTAPRAPACTWTMDSHHRRRRLRPQRPA